LCGGSNRPASASTPGGVRLADVALRWAGSADRAYLARRRVPVLHDYACSSRRPLLKGIWLRDAQFIGLSDDHWQAGLSGWRRQRRAFARALLEQLSR